MLPAEHSPLTFARLLQERLFRDAVVAGDTDRPITWCLAWDEIDGPLEDVLVYAHAGQLDPAAVRKRGVVALIVAGATEVPELDVPVAIVPERITYREVGRLVAELALARETHVLRYGLTVHRSLAELLYRGAGLAALCHQLGRLSRCPVAILDRQRRPLACEPGELDRETVLATLHDGLPATIDGWHGHEPRTMTLDGTTCMVSPIMLGGRHDGWVAVLETAEPPHPHDLAEHRVVVEQAVTIVGTEMLRMRSVEQAEERARGDFVHALLHARFSNLRDLEARAAHYGFPTEGTFGVVVVGGLGAPDEADSPNTLFQLAREITRLPSSQDRHTLATVVGDVLAVIREVSDDDLAEYATVLEHEFARRVPKPAIVAFGRSVTGARRIIDSYREARITLKLRQRLGNGTARGFEDLRVFAVLADLATGEQGKAFAREMLAPLRSGGADLEQAVFTYVSCGGNVNAAARELHIHRNTMLYKLDRASRALRLDLRQAEHQCALWLAGKLDLLADTIATVDRDVLPT
ncbi:PucR family transcriptional regulator [Amycolatopsis alkalitolerans]|uniref:PucR family transcriptional regulator n=1 Tax=Amycolatopsis alkalitolerans TaxID=2547244 RepID=A0A5C4LVL5_9PSEU|nr:helix-turn-helix domain-containing protein [Amycolatopsis alkalitolerans]TNC23434.1 PucR family transcriptional regulator [Amycolatopsis alkalitolerans]